MSSASTTAAAAANEVSLQEVTYGKNGIVINGILARPRELGEVVRPGILVLHGGGNSGVSRAMRWLAVALAKHGFVALSGTYRDDPSKSHDVEDAMYAIDFLSALNGVDPTRIGMTGQSRGAMTSYRLSAVDPRVRAILPIACGAPERFGGFGGQIKPDPRALSESRFMEFIRSAGGYPKELARPDSREPTSMVPDGVFPNILDLDIPVLVLHGTCDLHGAVDGNLLIREAAQKRGATNIRFNIVEGMGHFFDAPQGNLQAQIGLLAVDWFDHCLRGREAARDFEQPLSLPDVASWPACDTFAIREIEYPQGDVRIPGYLLELASGRANGDCVVYAPDGHGAAEASRLAFVVEALGKSGFSVLVTRYRSHQAQTSDDDDLIAAIDFLERRHGPRSSGVAIVGHGRGGMAALRTAAKDPRVKKIVTLAAPANLTRLIEGLRAFSPTSAAYAMSRMAGPDRYRSLSPHYYLDRVKAPTLLVHGSLDLMVPPEHMLWNAMGLVTTGNTSVEIYLVPWDTHCFDSSFAWMDRTEWVGRISAFISGHSSPGTT